MGLAGRRLPTLEQVEMRNYELVCIIDPQVGEAKFDETVERYDAYLKANGAEVANIDRWGLRQLAYHSASLKKRRQGYYVLYQFRGEPTLIRPLEHDLKLDEAVLRYLLVAIEGEFLRVPQLAPESIIYEGSRSRDRGGPGDRGGRGDRYHGRGRGDRDERERPSSREEPAAESAEAVEAAVPAEAEEPGV